MHRNAIDMAVELQANIMAFYETEWSTEIDPDEVEELDLQKTSRGDIVELLEKAKTDPDLKARLDAQLAGQLAPLIQQALQPQEPEGGQPQ